MSKAAFGFKTFDKDFVKKLQWLSKHAVAITPDQLDLVEQGIRASRNKNQSVSNKTYMQLSQLYYQNQRKKNGRESRTESISE